MAEEPDSLNERFGLVGAASFDAGRGGLVRLNIAAAASRAEMYLHGAHVTAWRPTGAEGVLWLSRQSLFQPGRPIRGGVPVCWPWFGPLAGEPNAPLHGFARLVEWDVESVRREAGGDVTACLVLRSGDAVQAVWPWEGDFELRHRVRVGAMLEMTLETRNGGRRPLVIDEALHSYFRVSDVRNVCIRGLTGAEYVDKADAMRRKRQGVEPLRFAGQTDRLHVNTRCTCVLDDPGLGRRISVAKSGSLSTVVWNPWADKARAMSDFGDEEWPEMVCVETANAADNAVTVGPGQSHAMTARIGVAPA